MGDGSDPFFAIATVEEQMYSDTNPSRLVLVEGDGLRRPEVSDERLTVYVDGSISCPKSGSPKPPYRGGFAAVFVVGDDVCVYGGAGSSDEMYQRGQDAELCGSMAALRYAYELGWRNIHVRFDCQEVMALVSEFVTKKNLQQRTRGPKYPSAFVYRNFVMGMVGNGDMRIRMSHVPGHSGDRFNSLADRTANKMRLA